MALADEIRKAGINVQRISLEVRIAGRVQGNVISVTPSHGFDQVNSQATITLYQKSPEAEEGAAVEVRAGYNGQTALVFRGELSGVSWAHFPAGISLDARSILARVEMKWAGGEYEYISQDDAAVVRNLLEKYGIPNTEANIESSGWTLGEIQPVPLRNGDTGQSLIAQIDELAGYRTFTIASGVVLRRRISGKAGPSAAWNFKKGVDIISAKRIRTLDGVVNHAIVRGLTYEDLEVVQEASAPNAYIPNPPGEAAYEVQSDLVETDAKALEIATRIIGDRNRRPERLELQVVGNPLIQPGATIQVDDSDLGVSGARVFVENVSHSISDQGFTTTIRTTGGNLSGYEVAAPVAQIALTSFLEGEDTGSGIETRIVLIADGSGSFDPAGGPLSYAWTVEPDVGTATPDSGTTPQLESIITGAATSITVTLVVTNSSGDSATASEVLPIAPGVQQLEVLWAAVGAKIYCSADGQQTWRVITFTGGVEVRVLCAIAPAWGQLWGATNGHAYASFDGLAATPVDLGAPHGAVAITAAWAHETDSTRLWLGFSDGAVYFGTLDVTAQAATWSLAGTVPAAPVNEIRESYGTFGELRATAGANEYYSTDAGASWSVGLAGTGTSPAAWRMAAGFDRNAVAFTAGDPILLEAGEPAPTITPTPTGGIRGISFGYRQQELYAADGSNPARLYRSDDTFATLDEVGSAAGLTQINHLIRSGNEDGIVYMAGGDGVADGGVIKAMRMASPWYALRTGADKVWMVGYGGAAPKAVDIILIVPEGPDGQGVWVYEVAAWGLRGATGDKPLPAGKTWLHIAASPLDPRRWIILATTGEIYVSLDAGLTWDEVTLTAPSGFFISNQPVQVEWSPREAAAWFTTGTIYNGGFDLTGAIWRGSDATVDPAVKMTPADGPRFYRGLVWGLAGDVVMSSNEGGRPTYRIAPDNSQHVSDSATRDYRLDRLPGGPVVVGRAGTDGLLYVTPDYRTGTAWSSTGISPGQSIAATADAVWGSYNGAQGIIKVTDLLSGPSSSVVAAAGIDTRYIRSDRQLQNALAARISSNVDLFVSTNGGATWQRLPGPPSASVISLIGLDLVEVISV